MTALLWLGNAAATLTIIACGLRLLVERARGQPLWLRVCVASLTVGAAFTNALPPESLDVSQVALNAGVAGMMLHRLRQRRTV
ncbi:MAG: hypothetical protein KIT36_22040 [Alphaproteobacteria bacterium]|nr:hypothetical protein [Alphaproteobacteria bacterium]